MEMRQGKKCPRCGQDYERELAVDAVIVKRGRVVLVKRRQVPFKGYWALPGGYVAWDETTEAAVVREVAEETGLKVEVEGFLGVYSEPERDPRQLVSVVYRGQKVGGKLRLGEEAVGVKWFRLDRLPKKLAFDHRKMIEDYKRTIENRW